MISSFKDNSGKWSGTRLTVFASFGVSVISWAADQFFGYKINEVVFCTFAGIVVSGLGFNAFGPKKNETTEK